MMENSEFNKYEEVLGNICNELETLNETLKDLYKSIDRMKYFYCDEDGWKKYDFQLNEMNKKLDKIEQSVLNLKN